MLTIFAVRFGENKLMLIISCGCILFLRVTWLFISKIVDSVSREQPQHRHLFFSKFVVRGTVWSSWQNRSLCAEEFSGGMSWNLLRNKGKYHRCCCVAVDYFPIWLYGHLLNENLQTIRPTLYLLYTTFSPYKTLDWQAPMPLNTTILLTEIQRPILPPLNSKVASAPLMVSYSQIRCIALRVCKLQMGFSVP